MQIGRKIVVWLGKFLGWCVWCLLALWTALALYFTVPLPGWLATVVALGTAGLFVCALRECRWALCRLQWRAVPLSTAALAVTVGTAIWYFGFVAPDPNQDWAAEHSRVPVVRIEGDKVYVGNVRNFTWRSRTDFTPGFYDREYNLNALDSMHYVVVPLGEIDGLAHVFVCFGFSDGKHVAVSVEGRRVKDRPYRVIASMFRQFQLIYVVGDERDVVGLRGAIWKQPVRFYPGRTTQERKRAIFLDMMERAHELEEHPEFYHLLLNNCMNNITLHLRRLGGRDLPWDLTLLLTGFSDYAAYNFGFIDTDLPFDRARQAFRIDPWMQQVPLDEDFSLGLRAALAQQVAEAGQAPRE
jgi:hypothetical protein